MISARVFARVAVFLFGLAFLAAGVEGWTMGGAGSILDTFSQWFFFDSHLYGLRFLDVGGYPQIALVGVGLAALVFRSKLVDWVFPELNDQQPFVMPLAGLVPAGLGLAGIGLVVSCLLVVTASAEKQGLGRGMYLMPDERLHFVALVRGGLGLCFLIAAAVAFRRAPKAVDA